MGLSLRNNVYELTASTDGSGVADRTNLQTAINSALNSVDGNSRRILLRSGIYNIDQTVVGLYGTNSANDFAQRNFLSIEGEGLVQINQVNGNQGHFLFQCPDGSLAQNLFLRGFWFHWNSQQTTANTKAVAIGFSSQNNPATNQTMFQIYVDYVMASFGYRLIGNMTPAGPMPIWGIKLSRFNTYSMSGSIIQNRPPQSVGCPNIRAEMGLVASPYLGGGEALFDINACDNAEMVNVECLQVTNVPLFQFGSSNFSVVACKGEACTYGNRASVTFVNAPIIANGSGGSVRAFRMNGLTLSGGSGHPPAIISAPTNGTAGRRQISVDGLQVVIASGANTLYLANNISTNNITFLTPPDIQSLGSGPAVVSLCDSANTPSADNIWMAQNWGGATQSMGDADFTWNGQTSAGLLEYDAPLTSPRALNFHAGLGGDTDNYYDGLTVKVVRTGNSTGSNLTVNMLQPATKVLGPSSWAEITWSFVKSGWILTKFGSL